MKREERLLEHIKTAFALTNGVRICSYVVFREGFPISRTYNTTVVIDDKFYITYDKESKQLEIFNTSENIHGKWYNFIPLKYYNDMEIAIVLYKAINCEVTK